MTPRELLDSLTTRGIALRLDGVTLMAKPMAALTPGDRDAIRQHKAELIELLCGGDVLTKAERHRLMDAITERCHQQYTGGSIDWPVVDGINDRIGKTFTRQELVKLLTEYQMASLRGGEDR